MPSRLNSSVIVGMPVLLVGLYTICSACDNPTHTSPTGSTDGSTLGDTSVAPTISPFGTPTPNLPIPPNPDTGSGISGLLHSGASPSTNTPKQVAEALQQVQEVAKEATDALNSAINKADLAGFYFRVTDLQATVYAKEIERERETML